MKHINHIFQIPIKNSDMFYSGFYVITNYSNNYLTNTKNTNLEN